MPLCWCGAPRRLRKRGCSSANVKQVRARGRAAWWQGIKSAKHMWKSLRLPYVKRKKVLNTFQIDYSLFVGDFPLFLGIEGVIATSMFASYPLLEYSQVITGESFYSDDFPSSFCNERAILMGFFFFKKRCLLNSLIEVEGWIFYSSNLDDLTLLGFLLPIPTSSRRHSRSSISRIIDTYWVTLLNDFPFNLVSLKKRSTRNKLCKNTYLLIYLE